MNEPNHTATKRLITNFFSLSFVQVANNVLPILTVSVIVRIIGPEKFGAINFAAAVVTYFTLLINYGFDLTATRSIAMNKDDALKRSMIFSEVLFSKIFLLCISIVAFVLAISFIPQLASQKKLLIFTFLACFSSVITPNWLYQGMQQLHRIAIFNFVSKLLFTICILLVVRQQQDYIFQPLIITISGLVVGVFSFLWAIKKYSIKIHKISIARILSLLWNEKLIFFSSVVITLYTTTNTIVLGIVQSNSDVAFYSAAWKLITIAQTLITIPLSLSLFPFIGESFGRGKNEGLDKIKQITPFITIFTTIAGVVLWLFAPWVIGIFYGSAFGEAATVLRILCFVPLIIALSDLFGLQTMVNLKMDKAFFNITLLGALIGLLLNFFLSKQLGAIGTAWAWLITEMVITLVMWLFLYSRKIQLIDLNYFKYQYLMQVARPFIYSINKKLGL